MTLFVLSYVTFGNITVSLPSRINDSFRSQLRNIGTVSLPSRINDSFRSQLRNIGEHYRITPQPD